MLYNANTCITFDYGVLFQTHLVFLKRVTSSVFESKGEESGKKRGIQKGKWEKDTEKVSPETLTRHFRCSYCNNSSYRQSVSNGCLTLLLSFPCRSIRFSVLRDGVLPEIEIWCNCMLSSPSNWSLEVQCNLPVDIVVLLGLSVHGLPSISWIRLPPVLLLQAL